MRRPERSAEGEKMLLKVGDRAPEFELSSQDAQKVRLSDFRGTNTVVLVFYVLANTPT